ncbi:MAG TPA: hypothetical protein GXX49_06745 [Clostridiaceae bacterium]|jgi:adenosylhomocysteine nucleosidase|nr:hypothetical protein [Clostridiaceae bacterium]
MIYIVIALMAEAKPVVKYFSLKKDEDSHKFLVYSSDEITLVISGTGMLSSAVATSFLAGRYVADAESSPIINLGICGARKDYYPTGTLISCNKITDNQTGRSFYPDLMLSHNFPGRTQS